MADTDLPELAMYWTYAPNILPVAQPAQTTGGGDSPPVRNSPMMVNFRSIRDTEQTLITSASAIVTAYESLKSTFLADKDTVYGQQSTMLGNVPTNSSLSDTTTPAPEQSVVDDPIQQYAQTFADGDGSTANPGMNPVQESALLAIANGMAVVGEFIAAMHNAAETYCNADFASILPGPD